MEATGPVKFVVQIGATGADAEKIDRLSRLLLAEMRELPIEVGFAPAQPPADPSVTGRSKAAALLTAGELAISALPGVLASVVAFLRSWVRRGDGKPIKIKWVQGNRSFSVDLPAGAFSHEQLNQLLAGLRVAEPAAASAASRKATRPSS